MIRYKSFLYRAASWTKGRRVVAKVELHFGELFPRVGFIVTNHTASNCAVVRFDDKRGTAEQGTGSGFCAREVTHLPISLADRSLRDDKRPSICVTARLCALCSLDGQGQNGNAG